jgi:IS5 family transposase
MSHRAIGQEALFNLSSSKNNLEELHSLIDWLKIESLLSTIYASKTGQVSWPPIALFKAQLLGFWYNLSDVKLAEFLEDRASFRQFCGFSRNEITPERTAFVRFRKALIAKGLLDGLFEAVSIQLQAKNIQVKAGTLIDATIIQSASKKDQDARFIKHQGKPARHGYKAHITAQADTALITTLCATSANVNDGKAGCNIIPSNPGDVFADSAYRGRAFKEAVESKQGTARVVCTGVYCQTQEEANAILKRINDPIYAVRCRIEKIFGTMKRSYGLNRMRWMGIQKAHLQIVFTAIAYNVKRAFTLSRS